MTNKESRMIAQDVVDMLRKDKWHKRWRNLALFLIVLMMIGALSKPKKAIDSSHIALINIDEEISSNSYFWQKFAKITDNTKALLILMNSPGGTVGDSERLYYEIEALREKMPITVLIENQATSGAYLACLASDRIYSYHSAIIGSIGVIFSNMILRDLMDKVGIENEQVTTGAYKGYPSSSEAMPAMVRAKLKRVLDKDNQWFLGKVLERRHLSKDILPEIKEAQVYNAMDALQLKLVDGFSTRREEIQRLKDEVGDLPLKDLDKPEKGALLKTLLTSSSSPIAILVQDIMHQLVGRQHFPLEHLAL